MADGFRGCRCRPLTREILRQDENLRGAIKARVQPISCDRLHKACCPRHGIEVKHVVFVVLVDIEPGRGLRVASSGKKAKRGR